MPAARYGRWHKLTSTPRREIDSSLHPKIDAFLKAMRQCTQQLTPLEACLQDEMRILERLYYKGANQHRAALFWRRVQEVRKLGRRLLEVQLLVLLDDLRYSFYIGEGAERNPKILRGAWSQVPDAKFLNFMFGRVNGTLELVLTAKDRLVKAYHSLSLMMQTGAFLQLIVMLTAIVSRVQAIVEESESVANSLSSGLEALLESLGLKKGRARAVEKMKQPKDAKTELHEDIGADENLVEDLGSTVMRKPSVNPADTESHIELAASFWQATEETMPTEHESLPLREIPSIIVKVDAKPSDAQLKLHTSETRAGSMDTSKVKKKKKKKRDEIDEIFGLL